LLYCPARKQIKVCFNKKKQFQQLALDNRRQQHVRYDTELKDEQNSNQTCCTVWHPVSIRRLLTDRRAPVHRTCSRSTPDDNHSRSFHAHTHTQTRGCAISDSYNNTSWTCCNYNVTQMSIYYYSIDITPKRQHMIQKMHRIA